tara:strand:- start:149 stop:307 length:159 start_codon:yes stop_codon:yes gene_type:complete
MILREKCMVCIVYIITLLKTRKRYYLKRKRIQFNPTDPTNPASIHNDELRSG